MKKKFAVTALTSFLAALLVVPQTYASLPYGYKLDGGVNNRKYYVDGNAMFNKYFNDIVAAMDNWNTINSNSTSSVDVSFNRSASNADSQINFYTNDYGTIGWVGFTYFKTSNGTQVNGTNLIDNTLTGPIVNYAYCNVQMNTNTTDVSKMKNTWKAIAAHEIGHAFGLDHYTDHSVLMDKNIALMTSPTGITSDEIDGIRKIYK